MAKKTRTVIVKLELTDREAEELRVIAARRDQSVSKLVTDAVRVAGPTKAAFESKAKTTRQAPAPQLSTAAA